MFAIIPWDVWVAAALCVVVFVSAIFDSSQLLTVLYTMLFAYVAMSVFGE